MLLMEHYNIKCWNNLLGGKLWTSPDQQKDSTGSMDQSAWRYSKIERLVGVSLTCNQLYLFWLRREVEKKTPDTVYFSSWADKQFPPLKMN